MFGGIPLGQYLKEKGVCVGAKEFGVTKGALSQARKKGTAFVFFEGGQPVAYIIKKLGTQSLKRRKRVINHD